MHKNLFAFLLLISFIAFTSCTFDDGNSISKLDNPATQNSELPFLYSDNSGSMFLSWVEPGSVDGEYKLMYSKLREDKWTEAKEISRSTNWFVNWADYPSMVTHSGEAVAAHMLKKIPGNTYSYNVNIRLRNADDNWGKTLTPHFDSTATEHGFVSMVPLSKEKLLAAWLDGRRTDNRTDEEYYDLDKAMTFRSAVIDSSGSVSHSNLIDESVCDCCQTSMVMTEKGPFVAYRNRTENEVRDIYYSRYEDNSWSIPVPVHEDGWKIGACPVNGPKVAAKDSVVAVSWYTRASDTPTVKAAISNDYGKTFGDPFTVNSGGTSGRVDAVIIDTESVFVSDISKSKDTYYLNAYKLNIKDGTIETYKIAKMDGSRRSGFPQMELANGELIFAWTDVKDDTLTKIRTAALKL